jgi:hypothetical protein
MGLRFPYSQIIRLSERAQDGPRVRSSRLSVHRSQVGEGLDKSNPQGAWGKGKEEASCG